MKDDEDQELEQYVSQHKDESLRQIKEGMEKKFGCTRSTKWITPRRAAALLVEDVIDEEAELPSEEEIEGQDETAKEEEDPEIIKINREIKKINLETRRKEAKEKRQDAMNRLALKEQEAENIKNLSSALSLSRVLRKTDRKFINLLKERLEVALEKAIPTWVNNAKCPECDGWFLWRYTGELSDKYVRCFVCQEEYTLED